MPNKIFACGILRRELEHLLGESDIEIVYMDAALHVDDNKLAGAINNTMAVLGDGVPVVIGTRCHPDMEQLVANHGGRLINADSCIDMLLGGEKARLDTEADTFYLTGGWLENWREIFITGLGWDAVDARQNFGYYDRILLLDTGIAPIDEMQVLEFYEYTQVPVEIMPVTLDHLKKLLEDVTN